MSIHASPYAALMATLVTTEAKVDQPHSQFFSGNFGGRRCNILVVVPGPDGHHRGLLRHGLHLKPTFHVLQSVRRGELSAGIFFHASLYTLLQGTLFCAEA